MLSGMSVFRIVAAPDMSASPAQAKMNPGVADRQTLLTATARWGYGSYAIQVRALLASSSHGLPSHPVLSIITNRRASETLSELHGQPAL